MITAYARIVVPTPGTPVRVTAAESLPNDARGCHGLLIQALKANTGAVYIGDALMNKTTEEHCYATLPIPTSNFIPSFSVALTLSPGAVQLRDFYIDADNQSDGVIVTALIT